MAAMRGRAAPGGAREFQAVILAGGTGSGLYPLTLDAPKSLLPLAGAPMLSYQLWALEAAGFDEAIVVCDAPAEEDMANYVAQIYSGKIRVDLHAVDGPAADGTAAALRSLRDKLKSDFFVLAGDVVTTAALSELADAHRLHDSAITMLLQEFPDAAEKDRRKVLRALNKNVINFFGLVQDEETNNPAHARVVAMKSGTAEDPISVSKALLARHPRVKLHSDLIDGHTYILRRWVLDLLCDGAPADPVGEGVRGMPTLRTVFLPFYVNELQERCVEAAKGVSSASPGPLVKRAVEASALASPVGAHTHALRCYAYVAPSTVYLCRANTIFSYGRMNHELTGMAADVPTPWPKARAYPKMKSTTVGRDTTVGDKALLNNCVVGSHCTIGEGAMLSNVVVMDHCTVGRQVVAQNAIISQNVTIEDGCNLSDTQLQAGCIVGPAGARLKGQVYLRSDFSSA